MQNYNKFVSAKKAGGKKATDNTALIWRISNSEIRTKGFTFKQKGSYYVSWKAKVYVYKKTGSGSKTKWTSAYNDFAFTKETFALN